MGPARIAVDARYGLRSPRRGVGEYVYHLLRALADLPHPQYELIVFGDGSADPSTVHELSAAYRIFCPPAPNFFWWEQAVFGRAARRAGADGVHGTANIAPLSWSGPLFITLHDVIEWHRGRDFPSRIAPRHHASRAYRMNAMRWLAPRARVLFTVSQHARGDIVHTLKVAPERIWVTPLAPKRMGEPGGFPKAPAFLALGALDPRKNLTGVLEGLAKTQNRDITLDVVGMEPHALPGAKALAQRLGVAERVAFSPMVSDAALGELYRKARGLVYLSWYEGFGLPVLEAMALACPVIASNRSAVPEIAGDAAILVDPADGGAVARALDTLWGDEGLAKRLAAAGVERARGFTWTHTAAQTHEGYLAGLAGGR